jgi:anti-sigma factor RsiW
MTDRRHPSGSELMAWRDGELPTAAADALAAHVAVCTACSGEVQALDAARALLAGDPAPPLAPTWPKIAAARNSRDRLGRSFAWAAAAACAAGVALGLLVGSPPQPSGVEDADAWSTNLPLWPGSGSEQLLDMFSAGEAIERVGDA